MQGINKVRIKRTDLLKLATTGLEEISPHSLNIWLKIKTDNKYMVFNRDVVLELIDYALKHRICYENSFLNKNLKISQDELETLKDYWL